MQECDDMKDQLIDHKHIQMKCEVNVKWIVVGLNKLLTSFPAYFIFLGHWFSSSIIACVLYSYFICLTDLVLVLLLFFAPIKKWKN